MSYDYKLDPEAARRMGLIPRRVDSYGAGLYNGMLRPSERPGVRLIDIGERQSAGNLYQRTSEPPKK